MITMFFIGFPDVILEIESSNNEKQEQCVQTKGICLSVYFVFNTIIAYICDTIFPHRVSTHPSD